jgi:putative copper export protein
VIHFSTTYWELADSWQHASLVAIAVAAVVQTAFVVVYGSRPWWRHYVGRALFVKSTSLLVVLWLTIANTFLLYPGQHQVSTLSLWLVAVAIIYQFAALIRTPRHTYPPNDRYDEELV